MAGGLLLAPAVTAPAEAAAPKGFFGVMVNGPLDDPSVDLDGAGGDMSAAGVAVLARGDRVGPGRAGAGRVRPGAATDRKVLAAARAASTCSASGVRAPGWANGDGANRSRRRASRPSTPASCGR